MKTPWSDISGIIGTELAQTHNLTVAPSIASVAYSGPARWHGENLIRNRKRAENYAAREGATTLEQTSRGATLQAKHDFLFAIAVKALGKYRGNRLMRSIWRGTSGEYAGAGFGDIKTFTAGAGRSDVFRATELGKYIDNPNVQSVNGVPRKKLSEIRDKKGMNRAFRTVSLFQVREDFQQAQRTGDKVLIRDALEQLQRYEDQVRHDRKQRVDKSPEAKRRVNGELDARTDRLAALRQVDIREKALQEARNYIGSRLQQGTITQEQADRMMINAEHSAQDPQKAYRMRELARLKRTRDEIMRSEPDTLAISNYINAKERYEKDLRAVRQANGQSFVASNPTLREQKRQETELNLAGRPLRVSRKRHRPNQKASLSRN